jgi:3-oxocholest-4-en-26-oate---CoA ligase
MSEHDCFDHYRQHYPDGGKDDNTWSGRLDRLVKVVPDRLAFIQGERELTWAQFERRVNRLANGLLGLGLRKGERITIMGFNSIEWMEAYFAISRIGAVPVNLNPRFIPAELKHVLDDSDSTALIMEAENADAIRAIRPELPLLRHGIVYAGASGPDMISYEDLLARSSDARPRLEVPVTSEDFAFLFYTGGTTGYPKGTVWDGYNRVHGLDALFHTAMKPLFARLRDLPSEAYPALQAILPVPIPESFFKGPIYRWLIDKSYSSEVPDRMTMALLNTRLNLRLVAGKMRMLVVAPMFHGTAYETCMAMIGVSGGTSLFLKQSHPFDAVELWKTVERRHINLIVIVGDAFAIPMAEELQKNKYEIRSLAAIVSSGVRWSPSVKKKFLTTNPHLVLLDELGSTETSVAMTQVSASDDGEISQLRVKLTPTGVNAARVINPATGRDVAPGDKGELVFGGFNALGYWKDPERTARCFRTLDGKRWFHVGDEGTVDAEGYFQFIGRGSSIINTGGEKVYAEEVEEILMQHPGVEDLGVTGVPDARWGEAVTVLIKPSAESGLAPAEVVDYCRDKMAGYKKPKHIFFVAELPRTVTGKLQRKELKEMAAKLHGEKK